MELFEASLHFYAPLLRHYIYNHNIYIYYKDQGFALCFTHQLSPFTVVGGFICELCKDLREEFFIVLGQPIKLQKKTKKNKQNENKM